MGKKKVKKGAHPGELLVCTNPKATKQLDIEERYEAGMVLSGSEVKSLRAKHANLEGAYAAFRQGEVWLHNMFIAPYEQANQFNHEPRQSRKLLLRQDQLRKLWGKLTTRGYTLIPVKVYFKNGWAKVQLGLGKGKTKGDRREDLKRKADLREARAAMSRGKG